RMTNVECQNLPFRSFLSFRSLAEGDSKDKNDSKDAANAHSSFPKLFRPACHLAIAEFGFEACPAVSFVVGRGSRGWGMGLRGVNDWWRGIGLGFRDRRWCAGLGLYRRRVAVFGKTHLRLRIVVHRDDEGLFAFAVGGFSHRRP